MSDTCWYDTSVRPLRFIFAQIIKKDMQAHKEVCEFFFL